jgi:cyclase
MNTMRDSRAASGLLFLVSLLPGIAAADSAVTRQRTVTRVADGVYAIRHPDAPDTFPQGNTTVIIGSREVLVVDSGYLPSSAREDIAQIRQWTDKPVRYLLNTHWHPDHLRGNAVYADAFPGITILAHTETKRLQASYDAANLERYPKRLAALKADLAQGRGQDGKPLSAADTENLRKTIAGREQVAAELQGMRMQPATLTFDHAIDIDLGDREVRIRHLGRGDTLGDAWAYLPKEKLLISGDVLVHPVPYFFAGYPADLASTLRQLEAMDIDTIVPGHGEILHDKTFVRSVIELLDSVIAQVNAEVVREGSLAARIESVRKVIDVAKFREQFAGSDPDNQEYFDESIAALIQDAFNQAPK